MAQKRQNFDYSEISLVDYLKVVLKRKFWIIWIILIFLIFGLIFTILSPKTYQSKAILKIGSFNDKLIQPPKEIVEILNKQFIFNKIVQVIKMPPHQEKNAKKIKSNLSINNEGNLISIHSAATDPKEAQMLVQAVSQYIIKKNAKIFEEKNKILVKRIAQIEEDIARDETELKKAEFNARRFQSAINTNQALILQGFLNAEANIASNIEELKKELAELKSQQVNNKMSRLIIPASLPQQYVRPNLKLDLVATGTLGVFVGIFWAFCLEWWEKNKDKLRNQKKERIKKPFL